MRPVRRSMVPLLISLAVTTLVAADCSPPPPLYLNAPGQNAFHDLGGATQTLEVRGGIGAGVDPGTAVVTLHLNSVGPTNAIPVTLDPLGRFTVPLDVDYRVPGSLAQRGLNTVFARLQKTNDPLFDLRVAVTVAVGESSAEWGPTADTAISLRLNTPGLAKIAAAVGGTVAQGLDIEGLIGTDGNGQPRKILDQQCIPTSSCLFRVDGFVRQVRYDRLAVGITPRPPADASGGYADLDVDLEDLRIHFEAYDVAPPLANIYCSGYLQADPLRATSAIDQLPDGEAIRADQISAVTTLHNFQLHFDSGAQICNYPPLTAYLQSTLAPQLEAMAEQEFATALGDPDGTGPQRPIVEVGVENAINGLGIGQDLQPTLRMDLHAEFTKIEEDAFGITYWTRTTPTLLSTLCQTGALFPGACPAFGASGYLVALPPTSPLAGPTAPGSAPYDLGLFLSESFLGQIVKGFASSGGLSGSVTSMPGCAGFNLGGSTVLTAGCLLENNPLALAVTGLQASDLLEIRYRPTVPPVFTGGGGPLGSHAAISIAGLHLELLRLPPGQRPETLATVLLRLNGGLSLTFESVDATLGFDIEYCTDVEDPWSDPPSTCSPDATATTLTSSFPSGFVTPSILDWLVNGSLLPEVILPTLAQGVASFPIPRLLGYDLEEVETSRDQDFLSTFLDLVPPPCPECI